MTSSKAGVWKAKAMCPVFDASLVGLQSTKEFRSTAKSFFDEFMSAATSNPQRVTYELDVKPTIAISRPRIVSGYFTVFSFTGGAHPNTFLRSVTVGLVGGKPKALRAKDILVTGKQADLLQLLQAKLHDAKQAKGVGEGGVVETGHLDNFVVTPGGITWLFEPYAVGAYVEGAYLLKCSWKDLRGTVDLHGPLSDAMSSS
jgi:hypothetical protein